MGRVSLIISQPFDGWREKTGVLKNEERIEKKRGEFSVCLFLLILGALAGCFEKLRMSCYLKETESLLDD